MKFMKKYGMLALATIFMFSLSVLAQDPAPHQDHHGEKKEFKKGEMSMISPEKRAERMAKELELTDAQKTQVQALFEKQEAKRHQEMEKAEKMRAEMKAKFENERKANDEELTKIIGQEKFQKLQAKRTERLEKMKERREMRRDHSKEDAQSK